MRRFASLSFTLSLVAGIAISATGCQSGGMGGGSAEPKTEDQKTFYAVGLWVAGKIQPFNFKQDELNYVFQGIRDGVTGKKPAVEMSVYGPKLNELAKKRGDEKLAEEKAAAVGFLEAAAKEQGAEKTESGLIIKTIKEGTGESPKAADRVKVHYHGTLRDGKVFDSSVERKQPATFALNQVVPCWTEGVQKIKVGGKAKLTCPANIAYGDQGRPGIPPGAPLTFEIELLAIEPAVEMPAGGPQMPPGMHAMPPLGGKAPPPASPAPAPKPAPAPATKK